MILTDGLCIHYNSRRLFKFYKSNAPHKSNCEIQNGIRKKILKRIRYLQKFTGISLEISEGIVSTNHKISGSVSFFQSTVENLGAKYKETNISPPLAVVGRCC